MLSRYRYGIDCVKQWTERILQAKYFDRARAIIRGVNDQCFDSNNGLYPDGPGAIRQFSQHVQIFAVLADAISGEPAKI
ncbi:hypothetical protein EAF04_007171 [Stromatinia cepivora]|nr:hypothetical protein EAF04_007171 [Stromatinia cepivora]